MNNLGLQPNCACVNWQGNVDATTIWLVLLLTRLTHWGRVTHICVNKLTTIGSDNGLSPGRRQAIIWTNDGILLIRTLGTNFSEILSEILTFSFKKMRLKVSSAKCRPYCLGLNVLNMLLRNTNTGTSTVARAMRCLAIYKLNWNVFFYHSFLFAPHVWNACFFALQNWISKPTYDIC